MTQIELQCADIVQLLSEYLDQHLDDEQAAAMQRHISTCQNCRVVLDSTQRTIWLYRDQQQATLLSEARYQALYQQIAAAFRPADSEMS
jgi:anti-sigma factor RsiW